MIARTVTLPMAEVLAQAPEVSPWWDQTDIGDLVVRTLDDLGIADRMWVALHILGPTPTERLLIVGMSRRGWIGFWTRDEMMAVSSLSYDAVSRAALGLERKKNHSSQPGFPSGRIGDLPGDIFRPAHTARL